MQYTVESQHKRDCYYCHHALLPSWCWACPITGKESVSWNELKPLALFKVHFVCCSLFILYIGSATYTLPPTALASSASLCDELSFFPAAVVTPYILPWASKALCLSPLSLLPLWGCVGWSQQHTAQLLSAALHCTAKYAASSKTCNCEHNGA